jgi:rubredoxin
LSPLFDAATAGESLMKAFLCVICGYIYEEEKGDPTSGIAPGTRWNDVPANWRCPDCGAAKDDFEMIEI